MEKKSGVTFVALNLPEEYLDFVEKLNLPNYKIERFYSPEGMVPLLKTAGQPYVIIVNADVMKNNGHNEISKLLDILKLDPYLGVYPVFALTSQDDEFQQKILKMGFASQVISIYSDLEKSKVLVENTISIFLSRFEMDLQVMKRNEESRRENLQQLEDIDKVSGIYGKEAFCKRTEEMLKAHPDGKFVIVRWDVDRFKVFNDTYGVEAGDEYLRYIGDEFIKRNWQAMTYGRWVSDHFVMCIEEKLFSGPAIHNYITNVVHKFKYDFEFIVRMGVYRINDSSLSVRLMCDRALLAIESIKGNFERRIAYYDDSMRGQLLEEQDLINGMEAALKNKEFVVYYQPQYNFASGKMTGAEALVRWNHPEKGMIRPDKFIPLFEQNGFISHLDEYVWESVCQTMRKWIDTGVEVVPISVNISRRDIYNPKLCDIITGLTEKYGIDPTFLRLEITESAYMEDPTQLINVVAKLKAAGFTLEMDDFGSGYSSLNTLKDVPVDILKLDLKFLVSDGENTRGGSILTSVVRMANWLKMPVIAEGIETKHQAEFLKSIGCSLMQGYLFSRPIPETDFKALMDASDLELVEEDDISENLQNAIDFMNLSTQNALLFNSFVGGAAIIERAGDVVENVRLNDQFFETIGISREDYASRLHNTMEGFTPETAKNFIQMLDEAKSTGKEAACDCISAPISEGKEPYWTRNRARYLASTGGRDLYYVAVENITQRMNLYHRNIDLANELSLIMDSVPCGIIKYDELPNKRVVKYVNQYAANIFGRTVEEFVETFSAGDVGLIYDEDISKLNSNKSKALSNEKESYSGWLRIVKKNGTMGRMYSESKVTYGKSDKKKIISITVILVDLSQQIEGDVEKFVGIIKPLFDEIIEKDYEDDTMQLVQASNEELRKAFGGGEKTTSDVMIPWLKTIVAEDYRKQVAKILDEEYIKSVQANNETPMFEYEVIEDGKRVWQTTTLLQVGKSKYLICTKKHDQNPNNA